MKKLTVKQCRYLKYLLGSIRERLVKVEGLESKRLVEDLNVIEDLIKQELNGEIYPEEQDWNETVSQEISRAVALRKKGP